MSGVLYVEFLLSSNLLHLAMGSQEGRSNICMQGSSPDTSTWGDRTAETVWWEKNCLATKTKEGFGGQKRGNIFKLLLKNNL